MPGKILAAWRHASIEVLLSDYILDELRRVLPRLAHRHGLTVAEMSDLVDILAIQFVSRPVARWRSRYIGFLTSLLATILATVSSHNPLKAIFLYGKSNN